MKFPKPVITMVLHGIFGEQTGNVFQHGLVDSNDETDFERKVSQLKSVWQTRLSPYTGQGNNQDFHDWFVKY